MYTKDKTNRLSIRFNDDQLKFIKHHATMLEMSPSQFVRLIINSFMSKIENDVLIGDDSNEDC